MSRSEYEAGYREGMWVIIPWLMGSTLLSVMLLLASLLKVTNEQSAPVSPQCREAR